MCVKVGVYYSILLLTSIGQILCSMFPKNVLIVEILLSDMFEWCLLRPFAQKKGKLFPENVHESKGYTILIWLHISIGQILCSMFPENVLIVKILLSDMFEWCRLRPFAQKKGQIVP